MSKKIFNIVYILLAIICICGLSYSVIKIVEWKISTDSNKKIIAEIRDNESSDNIVLKLKKEKNEDTVAYLKVPGTSIDYPVVKASDNKYYLKRNFNKEKNLAGWVFADYRNKFDGNDKNIIIYAHNMTDGSMFGTLSNTLKSDWLNDDDKHIITFITEDGEEKYQVFSVYKVGVTDDYLKVSFNNDKEFLNFANELKKSSKKNFDTSLQENDKILTLSTCGKTSAERVVVHAKKI